MSIKLYYVLTLTFLKGILLMKGTNVPDEPDEPESLKVIAGMIDLKYNQNIYKNYTFHVKEENYYIEGANIKPRFTYDNIEIKMPNNTFRQIQYINSAMTYVCDITIFANNTKSFSGNYSNQVVFFTLNLNGFELGNGTLQYYSPLHFSTFEVPLPFVENVTLFRNLFSDDGKNMFIHEISLIFDRQSWHVGSGFPTNLAHNKFNYAISYIGTLTRLAVKCCKEENVLSGTLREIYWDFSQTGSNRATYYMFCMSVIMYYSDKTPVAERGCYRQAFIDKNSINLSTIVQGTKLAGRVAEDILSSMFALLIWE